MEHAIIIKQAIIAREPEIVIATMLSVLETATIEITSRKTPKYNPASLRKNSVNSDRIILLYLINRISMEAKARNMITRV
jgi:hypothetical protein